MTFSFAAKASVLLLFLGSTLYVHLRGKARLPVLRQFVNHSALFAPYNALMYLFSGVPSKPYLDRSKFPELDVLRDNWEIIRDEAMHLFDEGYIRAAEKNNDAGFGSFFKKGWKRFYLKWYDKPLPSAETLCPKTVALVSSDSQRQRRDVCVVAGWQPPQPAPRSVCRLPALSPGLVDAELRRLPDLRRRSGLRLA